MPIAKTTEDYVLCSTSILPHQMAKPTALTFQRILLSINAQSAEKLQFTSLIQPGKIVACLAQKKREGIEFREREKRIREYELRQKWLRTHSGKLLNQKEKHKVTKIEKPKCLS